MGDGGRGDCKALILEGEDFDAIAGEVLDISQHGGQREPLTKFGRGT